MTYRIRCCTLFNIARTGILNRRAPASMVGDELTEWEIKRNTQSNFDTILQVVSLRTQPENISIPKQSIINFKESEKFGFLFDTEEDQACWEFEFTVNYHGVFNDGINELGALYEDCNGVPMINLTSDWKKLPNFLDSTPELRNIYFEVITDE